MANLLLPRRGTAPTVLVCWVCLVGSPASTGGQVPLRTLAEPSGTLPHAFNRITALHELRDGRVVVVDASDRMVMLADFAVGDVRQLGREGAGPKEYRLPVRLLRLGGDSVGVEDAGNRRLLVITGDGRLSGFLSIVATPVGGPAARGQAPSASDGLGRLYALGSSPFTSTTSPPTDAAPIERWRVGSLTRDTVAYLPLPPASERVLPPGEGSRAFQTHPQWAVGLDGRIAIVGVSPYAVDIVVVDGSRVRGGPIPHRRIPVSETHQQQWRDDRARLVPVMVMMPGTTTPTAMLRRRPVFEPIKWPAFLPPFLDQAARYAPDGYLWIERTTAANEPPLFDVVDSRGSVVEQVRLPPRTRLVGFSHDYVYLAMVTADDQELLGRVGAPRRGGR